MPAAEKSQLSPIKRLGIIAGSGALPGALVKSCQAQGIEPFIIAFKGQTDPHTTENIGHIWTHMGAAGSIMQALEQRSIHDLVFIGGVRRPSLADLHPDFTTLCFFAKHMFRINGDNDLLGAMRILLEERGFTLHGIHRFMPELLMPRGLLAGPAPDAHDQADIDRGITVLKTTGALDIGQAVVVQGGIVLGIEAAEGTDALITRCAALRRKGAARGVVVKLAKPGQDPDLDLPTIGPDTIDHIAAAGLAGLAAQSGATLMVDPEEIAIRANHHKIFVIGITPDSANT